MSESHELHELADLLQELKERSGRSYTALANRTGLSRSSVHRYCQGLTVPGSFGAVERIARVCGAEQVELDRLYRAWARADAQATAPDTPPPHQPPSTSAPLASRRLPLPLRLRLRLPLRLPLRTLLLVALIAATSVTSSTTLGRLPGATEDGGGRGGTSQQRLIGPHWSMAPQPLEPEFFGVTMNTNTGDMPDFRVSGVRLWDGETRWGQVEPERGEFTWQVLDRMVEGAERVGLPVLFTFGGTPGWAAPDGAPTPYGDDTRTPPPDDLADWDRFVGKVATRYRGRIGSYELWDNVGAPTHYTGSMRTLAEMVRRASRIIRRVDPKATVACPSFGKLWERQGQVLLREFTRTGAYQHCDAAALKLHPRRADGPPEEIIELAGIVQDILYREDAGPPLWNTGPGKDIATVDPLGARRAENYAVRFYLAGLYSRKAKLDRMYFYSWGSTGVPLVVQPVSGAPTEAGRRIGRLQQWLTGARITACGQGASVGLPEGAYECRFRRSEDPEPGSASGPARDSARAGAVIRWTKRGRASGTLEDGAYLVRHMDGSSERVRAGGQVEFGEAPVLIEHRKH